MNRVSKIILAVTNKLKPLLLKLFPVWLLQKLKGKMISSSFGKLEKTEIIPYEPGHYKNGVNLIGNIKAETGLGQSCRLVASALKQTGITYLQMDKSSWDYRYNTAYWLWELEEFSDEWTPCFHCLRWEC